MVYLSNYDIHSKDLIDFDKFIEHIKDLTNLINKHGALGHNLLNHFHGCVANCEDALSKHYSGEWEAKEYAEKLFNKTCGTSIPPSLRKYINHESLIKDELGEKYLHFFISDKVYIFFMPTF